MTLETELLTHIIAEHLPGEAPDSLTPEDDLIHSGILDSLALVKLVTHLEQRYGLTVGAEDITPEHFGSAAALARYVGARRGGAR